MQGEDKQMGREYTVRRGNGLHSFPRSDWEINQNGDNSRRIRNNSTYFTIFCVYLVLLYPPLHVWDYTKKGGMSFFLGTPGWDEKKTEACANDST